MTVTFLGESVIVPFSIESQRTRFLSDTVGLRRRTAVLPGHRWAASFSVVPSDPESFLVDLAEMDISTTFDLALEPFPGSAQPKGGTAISTSSGADAGDDEVSVQAANNRLVKGCFIRFANHDKLYKVNAAPSGSTTPITPALQAAVPNNTRVHYWNTTVAADREAMHMTCLLDLTANPGISFSDGIVAEVGPISVIEAT